MDKEMPLYFFCAEEVRRWTLKNCISTASGRPLRPATSGEWIDVENPADMKIFARVPRGAAEDIDRAARAAKAAFPAWAAKPLSERIALMERFLAIFRSQEEEIIDLEIKELGAPWAFAKSSHCEYQYTRVRSYIDLAPEVPMVEKMPLSTVYREPVGVIGCITPWNYPLGQVVQKVIPALLTGNTVVLKPSQHTPLSCYLMADAFDRAGFPKGVFNMVTGRGAEVGDAMATHPMIDMISFTGSTSGGIQVARQALGTVKRITLELGGKSPDIFLPMDDYDTAIRCCFNSIFLNSGQTCTALSRLIIPKSEEAKIEARLAAIVKEYTVGDPADHSVKVGPLASLSQYRKVRSYIEKGLSEGARLLAGGVPGDPVRGYYVEPTIFTGCTMDMTIARDEIFGPVLCVFTYEPPCTARRKEPSPSRKRSAPGTCISMTAPATPPHLSAATKNRASAEKAACTACWNSRNRKRSLTPAPNKRKDIP